jgi:uncharacterized membrane protein YtjA (UPF0391 family)
VPKVIQPGALAGECPNAKTVVQAYAGTFNGWRKLARRRRKCVTRGGEQTVTLLKWALIFFLISIVAGILGFTGISAASADIARILFYIFVVIFLVLLILGLTIFRV